MVNVIQPHTLTNNDKTMSSDSMAGATPAGTNLRIVAIVSSTFVSMLCIGMTLTVLPPWMNGPLGFDAVTVGAVISLQFVATLLSRPFSSQMADRLGAKRVVLLGMSGCALNGVLILMATLSIQWPLASLVLLVLSRLVLGVSQGMIGTGSLSWGIGLVGPALMSKVISWNGIAGFGALAIGAPLGAVLAQGLGVMSMGLFIVLIGGLALALAWRRPASPIVSGKRVPFAHVFRVVAPYGGALALSSVGYGVIATFITLYYADQQWDHAAWGLSAFGAAFITARVLFAGTVNRFGGYRVTLVCFMVELAGLLALWQATHPGVALLGAILAGLGVSLIYPALGVVAVAKIAATSRSAALGAYSVFLDAAVGLTGPLAGFIASRAGYSNIFLAAALCSLAGWALCVGLYTVSIRRRARARRQALSEDRATSSSLESQPQS
ncbi:putative MFS family arabinose efflux permease [Kushneria marisflavi]|nr:putative MFS family arabinose efflux permease [Kushneria marisflavi]